MENISFVEFKEWLTNLIIEKRGHIPDADDWKCIKSKLDAVDAYEHYTTEELEEPFSVIFERWSRNNEVRLFGDFPEQLTDQHNPTTTTIEDCNCSISNLSIDYTTQPSTPEDAMSNPPELHESTLIDDMDRYNTLRRCRSQFA